MTPNQSAMFVFYRVLPPDFGVDDLPNMNILLNVQRRPAVLWDRRGRCGRYVGLGLRLSGGRGLVFLCMDEIVSAEDEGRNLWHLPIPRR